MKKGIIQNCKDPNVPDYEWEQLYANLSGTTNAQLSNSPQFGSEYLHIAVSTTGDPELTCNTLMMPPTSTGNPTSISFWENPAGPGDNDMVGFDGNRTRVHSRRGDTRVYYIYEKPWFVQDESSPVAAFCANRWRQDYYSRFAATSAIGLGQGRDREYSLMMLDHEGDDEAIHYKMTWLDEAMQNTSNARYLVAGGDNTIARLDTLSNNVIGWEWGHSGSSQYTMYGCFSRPTYVHSEDNPDNYGWFNVSDQVSASEVSTGIGIERYRFFPWEYGYEYLFYIRHGVNSNIINAVQIAMHPNANNISNWKGSANRTQWIYGANGAQYSADDGRFPGGRSKTRVNLVYNVNPAQRKLTLNAHNWGQRVVPANTTHWAYKRPLTDTAPVSSGGGGGGGTIGGGGCISLDTPVWMADGSTKRARDIRKGDIVLGYNMPGMVDESQEGWENWTTNSHIGQVVQVEVKEATPDWYNEYFVVNNDLKITRQHKLFIGKPNGIWGWYDIRDVDLGDKLVDLDGNEVVINSLDKVTDRINVMSLSVEEVDTYFVGHHPVLIHNNDQIVKN